MLESESGDRRESEGGSSYPQLPDRGGAATVGSSAFEVYKPGQGAVVRWSTAAGAALLSLWFAAFLAERMVLLTSQTWVRYSVPVVCLVLLLGLIFRLVGRNRGIADFLIATEGEMRKVNWSTRREVIGATKVVIVVLLLMGLLLFVVDVFFIAFFEWVGVLRIGMLKQMFGGGPG